MQREPRLFSQKFLGITLVPLTSRPRRAKLVCHVEGYFVAVIDKNKVAVSSDDAFKPNFHRNDWVQCSLARMLHSVGAITKDAFAEFFIKREQDMTLIERKKMKEKIDEFEYLSKDLGIILTKEQQEQLNRSMEITAS